MTSIRTAKIKINQQLMLPSAAKDMEQLELSFTADEMKGM